MHALPEKLAALRVQVEDSLKRQFVEQEAKVERRISEASERAEEAALRRAGERFEPKLTALAGKVDRDAVPVRSRLEELDITFKQSFASLKQEVSRQRDDNNKRFLELRAEMAPLSAGVRITSDSLRELEASQKELRDLVSILRKDLSSTGEDLRGRLEGEAERAQSSEANLRCSVHDIVSTVTAAQRTLAEHAEQMLRHAVQQAEQQAFKVEGRLVKRLEVHARDVALEAASTRAAEAAEKVDRQLEEHRGAVEAHAAGLQVKLEEEAHAVAAGLTAAAEVAAGRAAAERAERHGAEATRHIEQVKHEIEGRCLDALGELRDKSAAGALDWHAALGAQGDSLRAALRRAEERAEELAREAERRAAGETERQVAEAVAELRRQMDSERGELLRKEESTREDLRERLQRCLRDCQEHCEAAAHRHEATAQALTTRLLPATAAAASAEPRPASADGDDEGELPRQDLEPPPRRVGAEQRALEATQGLRREFQQLQQGTGHEVSLLRSEIADRLTRQEACASAVATANVTGEALGRISALEAALTRQRERLDSAVRDLGARCDSCRSDLFDARARSQQEAHLLGVELAKLQASGTSLVQGVCRALQVLGLLRDEPPAEPHLPPDGDPASPSRRSRGGMELRDLLDWEAAGQSLAVRVAQQWHAAVAAPWPSNLIELVQTKAEQRELQAVRASLRSWNPAACGPVGPALALAAAAQGLHMAPRDHFAEAARGPFHGKPGPQPQPPCTPRGQLAPLAPGRRGCGEAAKAT